MVYPKVMLTDGRIGKPICFDPEIRKLAIFLGLSKVYFFLLKLKENLIEEEKQFMFDTQTNPS